MNRLTLPLCFASALYLLGCATPTQMSDSTSMQHFYLGTYSTKLGHVDGRAKGISYWSLDPETGALTKKGGPWPIVNASHLCTSRDGKFLYAISETDEYKGEKDGYITSFAIDSKTGGLTEMGTISSEGVGPAYVSLDQSGRYLLLANYVAGNIAVYPRLRNGLLGEPTSNVQHTGSSINPERQEAPHPHSIIASPDNQFVLAADLGLDKIKVYAFDDKSGALEPLPTHDAITPAGSGPRHLVFHPSGDYVYLTLEMASQVAAYAFEAGKLTLVDIYSTLPFGVSTLSSNAEVRITQDGRFLYASNRGHDSIAAFQVNEATGALTFLHTISTEGKTPRNFGIAPNDRLIVVGNQDSHTILSYKIDEVTGRLTPTGKKAATPSPVLFHFE